jgi:hypothetical protein
MDTSAVARKATTEAEKQKCRQEGRCFECGKQGHLARDCPSKAHTPRPARAATAATPASPVQIAGQSANTPRRSNWQLTRCSPRQDGTQPQLLLDLLIITLSIVVTTIAYEATYARAVTKAALRATLDLTHSNPQPYTDPFTPTESQRDDDLVLDFRSSLLLRHVRQMIRQPTDTMASSSGKQSRQSFISLLMFYAVAVGKLLAKNSVPKRT